MQSTCCAPFDCCWVSVALLSRSRHIGAGCPVSLQCVWFSGDSSVRRNAHRHQRVADHTFGFRTYRFVTHGLLSVLLPFVIPPLVSRAQVVSPKFEALSDEHPSVVFCKVMGDADADSSTLMKREGIRAVPAFHFWKDGKRVDEVTGAKIDDVVATMKEHM